MPHAFGDVVVLILKSRDGDKDVLRRVNATVLASVTQPANPTPSTALKTNAGVLPEGEYLDVIYPRQFAPGQAPKAADLDSLFQRSHVVHPWKDGAVIGWEPLALPASAEAKKLRDFLFANFKSETGNETPEACAIRLLSKRVKGEK